VIWRKGRAHVETEDSKVHPMKAHAIPNGNSQKSKPKIDHEATREHVELNLATVHRRTRAHTGDRLDVQVEPFEQQ
jgi:hypothetical protein